VLGDYHDVIEQLTEVGRDAVDRGLVLASGGNLSARRLGGDEFVVTGSGTWLDRLRLEDFTVMGLDGSIRDGDPNPSSEWKLHQRTYQVRPDVGAIIHLHPQMSVLVDALGHQIRLITLDHAYYLRHVASLPYALSGSDELAEAAAKASRDCDAVILGYHGSSTLGDTVGMAYHRALSLEQAANLTFQCLQLGNHSLTFPPEEFARIHHA
jgi:L-fuculose-phosphate aldolase